MNQRAWARLVPLMGFMLVFAACAGENDTSSGGNVSVDATTSTAAPGGTAASEGTTTTAAANEPVAAPPNAGSATLTVGDQTWTFDNYYCRFGPEQTGNDRVSFSSGSFGSHEGVRIQLDASIQDTDKQGRYEGEGTIQSVTLNDIEDFENPSVDLAAESGFLGAPDFAIQITGDKVRVEASFDDGTTDEIESIPGTLEANCGAG